MSSYHAASNMGLADIACLVIDTHFEPSFLQ